VGAVTLVDGRTATAIIVGDCSNERGAALLVPPDNKDGEPTPVLLPKALYLLSHETLIEILCAQERHYGEHGYPDLTNRELRTSGA